MPGTAGAQAAAQPPATVIAIPPLSAPEDKELEGGKTTLSIAWQATQLIATDLRSTSELYPIGPDQKDFYSYPEVTAPSFPRWRSKGVKALVTGFVQARSDGRLTVGCYVYDVAKGRELGRKGFVVTPETGAGRRINAPASPIPRSPARRAFSTPASPMSRNRAAAPRGPRRSRSSTATATTRLC